jgi:hypothetical protein
VSLAELSPEQRRLVVHGYLAELPPDEGAPRLPAETVAAIRRAELALCSFELPEAEREQELELWLAHVHGLPEVEEEAALDRLRIFVQLLDPLRPAAPEEEAEEA